MNYYNYFTDIEETFIKRRGKSLLISPLDWALIESWQEREIPLHIVLRGIEKVFDSVDAQPNRKRSIKSIAYCKEEIEAQFAEWLESQTGKASVQSTETDDTNEITENENISEHISNIIFALKTAKNDNLKSVFAETIRRLEDLNQNLPEDFDEIEQKLTEIEDFLDQALLTNTDKLHLNNLEKENAKSLSNLKNKSDLEGYRKTLNLLILKKLREEAEIPRMSLFYL